MVLTNIAVSLSFVVNSESIFPPPVNAIPSMPTVEMVKSGYCTVSLPFSDA